MIPEEHRHVLGAFLRAKREALVPAAAGLPETARRRTPGLRREEVAQLCGISATWYSWIEQGRDIALSAGALARLADALQLTAAERAYLFELTRRRDPVPARAAAAQAAPVPALAALIETISTPAYLLDRLWQVRAWNAAAAQLFAPWLASSERNLLRWVFLDPAARSFICDWEDRARRLLAELRADTAHDPDDEGIKSLVDGLRRESLSFARFWSAHAVLGREGGLRSFNHPRDGLVVYEQMTLAPAADPDFKLVVLLPVAEG